MNNQAALPRPQLQRRSFLRVLRELLETLVLVVTIYALVNLATARFIVEGNSMLPNFETGQFLIVSRINYLLGQPERGDVVVFHYPQDPSSDFIKRVIGVPGDMIEMRNQRVYVNAAELDEPYIREQCNPTSCPNETWEVPLGSIFVMGDNRNQSRDSRAFGMVENRFLVGEALVRYWPPEDWGLVTLPGHMKDSTE
jgi:signal peptidase I